jgi:hypothetical protein
MALVPIPLHRAVFNPKGKEKVKKIVITAAMLVMSAAAAAQTSLPGSNWSNLTYNPSPISGTPEDGNILLQGNIEQGAIVGKLGGFAVNTYGAVAYSYDRNALAYNNKIAPSIGIKLQHQLGSNGSFDLGAALVHQRNYRGVTAGPSSGTGVMLYAQYWTGWNLKK